MTSPNNSSMNFVTPESRGSFELDDKRMFYAHTSPERAGFRHVWEFYLVQTNPKRVEISYPSGRLLVLTGSDAFAFLKIVRDRDAFLFDEKN